MKEEGQGNGAKKSGGKIITFFNSVEILAKERDECRAKNNNN